MRNTLKIFPFTLSPNSPVCLNVKLESIKPKTFSTFKKSNLKLPSAPVTVLARTLSASGGEKPP